MKRLLRIVFLLFFIQNISSQNLSPATHNFTFIDSCNNDIVELEYQSTRFPDNEYLYLLECWIPRGELYAYHSMVYDTNKVSDSIIVPKILFSSETAFHSTYWMYQNCDEICDGIETEFYNNGKLMFEGNFEKGKPIEIKKYRNDGTLKIQEFYKKKTLDYKKINYFDEYGILYEYEIYKNLKRKTIIKSFDKNGHLIEKNIERKFIVH